MRTVAGTEIALINPRVLIPIGGLAIGRFLGTDTIMTNLIGERFERDGRIIVPLPHPSGASQWFNAPENKGRLIRALEVLAALRRMTWARDLQNLTPRRGKHLAARMMTVAVRSDQRPYQGA